MLVRKIALAAAIATVGLLALGTGPASASTALRTDPGGALLSGATTITNTSSSPATWHFAGTGGVTCNQTFTDIDVGANSSASSVTGTLTAFTFTSCTDTIPTIAYTSCTLNPGSTPTVHINANNDTGGQTVITDPTIRCNIAGSTTSFCYFTAASATGAGNNATSTLTFSGVGITAVGGSGSLGSACGSTASLSFGLNHIVQGGTNRTVTVTTNGGGPAPAATVLRTDPGGALLSGATTVTNTSSAPATVTFTGLGSITCNQTFTDIDVGANSSASSVTGTLTAFTFTSCTDTIPTISYTSCTLNPGSTPTVHINANNDTGGTLTVDDPTYRCNIAGTSTSFCYYTASTAVGQGNNAVSTLTFSSLGVTAVGGSGSLGAACGSTGSLSFTLNHIVQGGTNRTVTVRQN